MEGAFLLSFFRMNKDMTIWETDIGGPQPLSWCLVAGSQAGRGRLGLALAGEMMKKTHRNSCLRVTPSILQEADGGRQQQRRQQRRRRQLRQRQRQERRRRRHTPGPTWQREVEGE